MTNTDAKLFRELIYKYGFKAILLEFTRMTSAYAAQSTRWVEVNKKLKGAQFALIRHKAA